MVACCEHCSETWRPQYAANFVFPEELSASRKGLYSVKLVGWLVACLLACLYWLGFSLVLLVDRLVDRLVGWLVC